jgi:hypothetical protein
MKMVLRETACVDRKERDPPANRVQWRTLLSAVLNLKVVPAIAIRVYGILVS